MVLAFAVHAETIHPASIPEIVKQDILKRHPFAQDLQGSHETHFGEKLLEVSYKDETNHTILELFTSHGHLLTNELLIEDVAEIQPPVITTLKREFQHYEIQKAELIGNPNGIGRVRTGNFRLPNRVLFSTNKRRFMNKMCNLRLFL